MKNKLFIILLIIALTFSFAGCKEKESQEIAGIVTELSDGGGFRVEVIGGFQEDLMQVHVTDKIKYEEGVSKEIMVGNAVGFTITGDVAESYPVQVTAVRILWNEPVVTGKILSAGPEAILIGDVSGIDTKLLQAWITEDTVFYKNIPELLDEGKTVSFTTTGEIMESDPPQVFVKRFVNYE